MVDVEQMLTPHLEGQQVVQALERRAQDLSLALNPGAIARKLREELVATVGPDKAVAYYIGASTEDGKNIKFEIARLGPRFLARLTGDTSGAELQLAHETTTSGGWRVSVGVAASTSFDKPKGSRMQGAFSVTIAR